MMFFAAMAFAQDDTPSWLDGFTLSGSADAYYRLNLNANNKYMPETPGDDDLSYYATPGSSFANQPGFAIGMANLVFGYETGDVGVVADLVFGPRGEDAVFLSGPSSNIVNQLYVYWNVSEKVTLTFGNWNTFLGYEVISPTANFNYSTSYMFSYGPFSHTGLKADFALDDNWSAMLAVMNPTDFTENNPLAATVWVVNWDIAMMAEALSLTCFMATKMEIMKMKAWAKVPGQLFKWTLPPDGTFLTVST